MFGELGTIIGMLVLVIVFMALFCFIGYWMTRTVKVTYSPYTGMPLWRASTLPFETKKKIVLYLQGYSQYDNRLFLFKKASFCRETGRIFSNSVNWMGNIVLDWSFLNDRYPGNWISWGSLSDELKEQIRNKHEDLEGFQAAFSSKFPSPRQIEPKFAYAKPGPLYVDIDTGVLLGWKEIPESQMEVLIVQKPIR